MDLSNLAVAADVLIRDDQRHEKAGAVAYDDLDEIIRWLVYAEQFDRALTEANRAAIFAKVDALCDDVRRSRSEAMRPLHASLYHLYVSEFAVPWESARIHSRHPMLVAQRCRLERAWLERETRLHGAVLEALPSSVEEFPDWGAALVSSHASNVTHPLFPFLRDEATIEQLREFHFQETPLDIFFSDILCRMMPGVYGALRVELVSNFWDEVGRGTEAVAHRALRLKLMRFFDISPRAHLDEVRRYVWEELALANTYFDTTMDRGRLVQAVGAMLATEMAVPGRIECQLEGCRRVGIPDDVLRYLEEHVTLDVTHAAGWMKHVVAPLLREHPNLMPDLAMGMLRRLSAAEAVCERMLVHLGLY